METKLHAVFNKTGNFKGFSANFSGSGFSYMHFATRSVTPDAFNAWVGQVQKDGGNLDRATYLELDKPSEHVPVIHYAAVAPDLFDAVVNMCVRPSCAPAKWRRSTRVAAPARPASSTSRR
jgi:cytochrome o ubiquinol oxidase subunit 2